MIAAAAEAWPLAEHDQAVHTEDSYEARVTQCLAALGIPGTYGPDRHMSLCTEAKDLVSIGLDIYGRDRKLMSRTAALWTALRSAAHHDGIRLLLVSAFRSVDDQKQIFERKIAAGQSLAQILKVNVPPGYSEHHTGRAVDLTTHGCTPLSEEFETTEAFAWLVRHGGRFGFAMTYPRENRFGVAYEPWHWAAQE